jgi:hypothetical protein
MPWPTEAELSNLVRGFGDRTLPASEWTHLAHLAVGTWHVRQFGAEEALSRLRFGILRLNEAHGTPNSDSRGYHETITRAYVGLIHHFLESYPAETSAAECVHALLASPLAQREALYTHYSKERLLSVVARRGWLAPDRSPLPVW